MNIEKIVNIFKSRGVMICFFLWMVGAIALTPIYLFEIEALYNIDIFSHITVGMLIGAILFEAFDRNYDIPRIFVISFVIFLLWEIVEISAVVAFPSSEYVVNIFYETVSNRIQDMFMDVMGFVLISFVYIRGGSSGQTRTGKEKSNYSLH